MYAFGKGETATTVSIQQDVIANGASVLIKGTVTDQSSGAKDTPAIADASMGPWMEYVYMQKPLPTNATGVTVFIDVLDSNGNYRNIGTTTSDLSGFFSFTWDPDIPGKCTVVATFGGTKSYYGSYSETA